MASTLRLVFITAMAVIAFTTAANAQVLVRSKDSAGINRHVRSIQAAELGQRKHASHQATVRAEYRARHNHRSYSVVREPNLNSIMFRLAPYDFSWA